MRILAVANEKGGSGKSTIATNLAVEASRAGKRVLLVDTDPQASALLFAAARPETLPSFRAIQLTKPVLHRELPELSAPYDLTVIDTGGRDTATMRSALVAAEAVVVPLQPSAYDVWAVETVLRLVSELATTRDFPAFLLLNQVVHGTVVAREATQQLGELLERYAAKRLTTVIHSRSAWKRAAGEGMAVTEWEPRGAAAQELRALCHELGLVEEEKAP